MSKADEIRERSRKRSEASEENANVKSLFNKKRSPSIVKRSSSEFADELFARHPKNNNGSKGSKNNKENSLNFIMERQRKSLTKVNTSDAMDKIFEDRYRHEVGIESKQGSIPPTISNSTTPLLVTKQTPPSPSESPEKIDKSLAIAEDFSRTEGLLVVGEALYKYNGKFYQPLLENQAKRLILNKYREEVSQSNTLNMLRNVVALLNLSTDTVLDEFPVNSNLVVFENGTLEVNTGRFRKNSPKDVANSSLFIHYDPNSWKMPYTEYFLTAVANNTKYLYERILEAVGYMLSNDIGAKSFFYLQGIGDSGKSLFCALIALFFPEIGANKVARVALQNMGDKFALGGLVNAKLNISEDLPDNPLSPTSVSRIKMISDANRLEVEMKYVQPFSIKPISKLLFASNHSLRLKEYDEAFVNRVVYIPFTHAIPKDKQDKQLLQKMGEELPALFNQAFEAYKRLVKNNYIWAGTGTIEPEISIVGSGISINREEILKDFLSAYCEFCDGVTTPTEELRDAYNKFCYQNNHVPILGDRFSRELSAVLPSTVQRTKISNQRRGYRGIKLKEVYRLNDIINPL